MADTELANHYDTLGVSRSAPFEVIAAAYKAQIRSCHPDQAIDDADGERRERRSLALGEALATLKDPDARARYDARLDALAAGLDPDDVGAPMNPDDAWAAAEEAAEAFSEVVDATVVEEEPVTPYGSGPRTPPRRPTAPRFPAPPPPTRTSPYQVPDDAARDFASRIGTDVVYANKVSAFLAAHQMPFGALLGALLGLVAWQLRLSSLMEGLLEETWANPFDLSPFHTSAKLTTGAMFAVGGAVMCALSWTHLRDWAVARVGKVGRLTVIIQLSAVAAATALVGLGDRLGILVIAVAVGIVILVAAIAMIAAWLSS